MTFEVIVLICVLSIEPKDCMPSAGARVVEKIGEAQSELSCMRWGLISSGGEIAKPKDGEYEKIICLRKRPA